MLAAHGIVPAGSTVFASVPSLLHDMGADPFRLRVHLAVGILAGALAIGACFLVRSLVCRLRVRERELRESLDALRRSEARYRMLTEHAHDLIYIVRADRTVTYANEAVARRIGRSVAAIVGRKADDVFLPAVVRPLEELFLRVMADGGSARGEARLPRTLGQGWVWYDTVAVRLFEEDGAPAMLCISRDISARKEMEGRLLAADRMVSMGTLAAGVAHEINNPLSYVLANLQVLREDFEEIAASLPPARRDEVREILDESLEGARRVRSIVRDLKTFSRADEDDRSVLDVHELLDTSIRMAGNQIRHRARLVKDYGSIPAVEASGKLGQVFVNLIVNAAQAIPEGHADENEIRVSTRQDGDRVLVEVTDTGCGIPEAYLAQIFEPFFTTKPPGEGTGLGLSICQGIVQRLGGAIAVESRVGKGTTFRVSLPVGAAAGGEAEPAEKPEAAPKPQAARGRILVVDDEPSVCRAVAVSLGSHGVTALTEAREALRRIEAGERFDLILCDLMMPEMTGAELYDGIARVSPDQARRMVFLSGGAFGADAVAFLARVPNPRFEKPFAVDELRATVVKLLAAA
jgi:PAS domain S-box-containing protein